MDGTVSLETNIAFLQQQVKRVAGEGSTVTRFKAVVCADHILVLLLIVQVQLLEICILKTTY